jgi:hypothetical protein
MVIVALPALAAIGHDVYLFYQAYGFDTVQQDLNRAVEEKGIWSLFASLGFIWTRYAPESYAWVVENNDEGTWSLINAILAYKAALAGAVLAGFFYAMAGLVKITRAVVAGSGRSSSFAAGGRKADEILGRKSGGFKYKRKF